MPTMRTALGSLAACAVLFTATPCRAAFPGHDGAIVYDWFDQVKTSTDAPVPMFAQSAIRKRSPHGEVRTLRGCTRRIGQPSVGDCSIAYSDPVVSPDGRRVAFDAGRSLALMDANGRSLRRLPAHSSDDRHPAFSPTGTRLAFATEGRRVTSNGAIWVSDLRGRHARRIAEGHSPAWSFGDWIAFLRFGGIYRVRPDGRGLRQLVARDECTDVAWSPQGTRLAFACMGVLETAGRDGHHPRTVFAPAVSGAVEMTLAESVAWSPSGARLAVTMLYGGLVTMRPDGSRVRSLVRETPDLLHQLGAHDVDWQPLPR